MATPADFPIITDDHGRVISRYADAVWDFTTWAGKPLRIHFGDGSKSKSELTCANADKLRQLVAWWLYGEAGSYHPRAYHRRTEILRPVFKLCSEHGIAASDLSRFPRVQAELPRRLTPSSADKALALLHSIHELRDKLGFTILDREGLRRLEAALPEYESRQTPYIPPRIWNYQVTRLRRLLEDHNSYHANVESLYLFCLDIYRQHYGSVARACAKRGSSHAKKCKTWPERARAPALGENSGTPAGCQGYLS